MSGWPGEGLGAPTAVLERWFVEAPESVDRFGEGHINATFIVRGRLAGEATAEYVLQRVSRGVFADPASVQHNFARVAKHLGADFPYALPAPLATRDGDDHVLFDGEFWRLARRIPGRCFQMLPDTVAAEAAGAAFGTLQSALDYFDAASLTETIPGFHRLRRYLASLAQVASRATHAEQSVLFELQRRAERYTDHDTEPPVEAIHGDCKVNNLLFDASSAVSGVLDFDTLMRGHWWWDFGDLVRSAALNEGAFNTRLYSALTRGFVHTGRRASIERDIAAGCDAPGYFAFMLAVRFLADHLDGDRYFRVARRGDNLARAEAQLQDLLVLERSDVRAALREGIERALG